MPFDDELQDLDPTAEPSSFEDVMRNVRAKAGMAATPPIVPMVTKIKVGKGPDPNDSAYDTELARQRKKLLGLDQKYDAAGNERKKSFGEKLAAAVNIAGYSLGGGFEKQARQQTEDALTAGEKTRVAKIAADQRREAVAQQEATKREKNAADAWYKKQVAEIDRLAAENKITFQEKLGAKAQAQADRERGISEGTSVEGKAKAGVMNSQAALNTAKAGGTLTAAEQLNLAKAKAGMQERIAAMRIANMPTGSQAIKQSNETGDLVNEQRNTLRGNSGLPIPPAPTFPSRDGQVDQATALSPAPQQRTAPLTPDVAANISAQPLPPAVATGAPPVSLSASPMGPAASSATSAGRSAALGGNLTFRARGNNPSGTMMPTKFAEKLNGTNKVLDDSQATASQAIGSYISGDLDDRSGIAGTQLGQAIRKTFGDIDPGEAMGQRMGTKLIAGSEVSDFGARVMKVLVDLEKGSLPSAAISSGSKVATYIGQHYARTLASWKALGSDEQRQIAAEIESSPKRMAQLERSMAEYMQAATALKGAKSLGKQVPDLPLSPNLFILTRSDDEIRKLYPMAKTPGAIASIRLTGGKGTLSSTGAPAQPSNDNRKLLDSL